MILNDECGMDNREIQCNHSTVEKGRDTWSRDKFLRKSATEQEIKIDMASSHR